MSDLHAELLGVVEHAIRYHPRSLQRRIGPSEIGTPCDVKLAYKLMEHPEINTPDRVNWKSTIGTAGHSWMEETFQAASMARPDFEATGGRYIVETKVDVGEIAGTPITGSCDLFVDGTVIDFKFVGDEPLRKYKKNGPGDQYRIQAHLYGRGWQRAGMAVRTVGVWFLPRNQELRQNHLWAEPYDESVAVAALQRAEGIARLTSALGTGAMALLRKADDYCSNCPFLKPGSTDFAQGCPGVPREQDPSRSLTSLIAK